MRLPRKIQETSMILRPDQYPVMSRKDRRKKKAVARPNDSKYIHKARNGKLYRKHIGGEKGEVLKDDRYGGRFL